ncbi:caspase family protein [Actinoplanes sp. NPDC000266]
MSEPARRFLIGLATTTHAHFDGIDRPELRRALGMTADVLVHDFGYELVPGFGINATREQLKDAFDAFFTSADRRGTDIVAVYYTGHAEVTDDGEFVLLLNGTRPDAVRRTGLKAAELASWIFDDTPVRRVLLILDTCESGAGAAEVSRKAAAAVDLTPIIEGHPDVSIISATRPQEYATSCAFTEALVHALRGTQVARYGPPHLSIDALIEVINDSPGTPSWQHARHYRISERESQFFPNPRHDPALDGLDLLTQLLLKDRPDRMKDMRSHFLLRARGLDIPGDHWLFTGRHRMLADLCDWLRGEDDHEARVVTGGPGSGKSAILGRLAVLSLPEFRGRVPGVGDLPPGTLPPEDSIAMPIYARGMTPERLLDAVCAAVQVPPSTVGELARRLTGRRPERAVVIDAIDEAADPHAVVDQILVPLVRVAAAAGLKLLLGMRPHLVDRFEMRTFIRLDAEEPAYADPASMLTYARRCLVELSPDSPYRDRPEIAAKVARRVAEAAKNSFLVALINSRSLANRVSVIDTEKFELPRDAAIAMRSDLEHRLGGSARKAHRLMTPLAFAQGDGLPWENIWAPLATAMTGVAATDDDVGWVMQAAAGYIVETRVGDRSAYRLYHEALAEYLRRDHDEASAHRAAFQVLYDRVPLDVHGGTAWTAAGGYTLDYLALHAARGGTLDPLLADPAYLLAAERTNLLTALSAVVTSEGRASAAAYREAAHRLTILVGAEALSYLELAAHKQGARELCAAIARLRADRLWTVDWARWRPQTPHRELGRASESINALALGLLNARRVVVTANSDRGVDVWDFATGNLVLAGTLAADRPPAKAAVLSAGPLMYLVTGGSGPDRVGQVTTYVFPTGEVVGSFSSGDADPSSGVGLLHIEGRLMVLAPRSSGALWAWDAETGEPADRPPIRQFIDDRFWSLGHLDDRSVAVTRSVTHVVRVHDIEQRTLLAEFQAFSDTPARSCAVGRGGGTLYFVAYSSSALEVWDTETGTLSLSIGAFGRALAIDGDPETYEEYQPPHPRGDVMAGRLRPSDQMLFPGARPSVSDRSVASATIVERDKTPILVIAYDDGQILCRPIATGARSEPPLQGHRGGVLFMLPTEFDGRPMLVTAGEDRTLRVWDVLPGTVREASWEADELSVQCLAGATYDGAAVAVAATADAKLRVWDGHGAEVVSQRVAGQVWDLCALSVDGAPIVYGPGADRSLRGWRLGPGAVLVTDLWTGRKDWISAVAAHRGSQIFVATEDGPVRLIDARTEAAATVGRIGDSGNPVVSLLASIGDGAAHLGAVQRDGALSLWIHQRRGLRPIARFAAHGPASWILIDAAEHRAVATVDGHLLLFGIPAGPGRRFRARARGLELLRTVPLESVVTAACYDDRLRLLFVGQGSSVKVYDRSFGLVQVISLGAGVRKLAALGHGRIVAVTDAGAVGLAVMRPPTSGAVIEGAVVDGSAGRRLLPPAELLP